MQKIQTGYLIFVLCHCISLASADEFTKQKVNDEYPGEARYLSNYFDKCSGQIEHSWIEEKKPKKLVVSFSRSEGAEKFEIKFNLEIGGRPRPGTGIYSLTKDTAFHISKLDRDDGFNLNKVSMSKLEREIFEVDYGRIARAALGGYQKSLLEMIESGEIKLREAKPDNGKPNLIEATFESTGNSPIKEIDVVFDSARNWVVTRQILKVGNPLRVATDYQVEYENNNQGVPTPKLVRTEKSPNAYSFTQWKFADVPVEQFRLPYYGLPDVIEKNKRRSFGRFELILTGLMLLFVGIGVFLYRLSRRTTKNGKAQMK